MEFGSTHTYIGILVTLLVSEVCAFPCRGAMCSHDLLSKATDQEETLSKLYYIFYKLFSNDDSSITPSVRLDPFSRLYADSVQEIDDVEAPKKKWGPYNRFLRIGRSPERAGFPQGVGNRNYLRIGKLPSSVFVKSGDRLQRKALNDNGVIRAG